MSTLKVNTLQTKDGQEVYTAKAWVNFDGTGTVAIRAAGNVYSITDDGTGTYTVNLTTALEDTSYSAVGSCRIASAPSLLILYDTWSTSSIQINTRNTNTNTSTDAYIICMQFFR